MSWYIERNFKTSMIWLLKPWRFCRKKTGPLESSLMAIAVASITGDEQR